MSSGPWMGCSCDADTFEVNEGPLDIPFEDCPEWNGDPALAVPRIRCHDCGIEYVWTQANGWEPFSCS